MIVLTSSPSEEDLARSSDPPANASVQKPVEPEAFIELGRSFEDCSLTFVRFPGDAS
ncbi:response regulator receiver protein [Natrinema sp. H-ect1]|uniref:response regulator receiver protein n=1 Tax=Natrinema sp. H-ect1 TaxID=3242700 RepID=UPI00359D72EC